MVDWPRYLVTAVVTYGIASYGSYRYSLLTKAQEDLRDVKDQKLNHDAASECSITLGNQCTDVRFVEEEDSVERKLVDEDVIFIQSQSAFSRWNFGIC